MLHSVMETNGTYAEILRAILAERCQSNPRYSLRAFARDLSLSPSRVSRILSGKLGLSQSAAQTLCKRLGLSDSETQKFCLLVSAQDSRSKKQREQAKSNLHQLQGSPANPSSFRNLDEEAFRLISEWHPWALLELTTVEGFKSDPDWIAKRLGISKYEVEQTLESLKRLNLLQSPKGQFKKSQITLTTGDQAPSEKIRSYHRQILKKAESAVTAQNPDERALHALTVAIHPDDFSKLNSELIRMRHEFDSLVEKLNKNQRRKPREVYALSMQFFRMTEKEK